MSVQAKISPKRNFYHLLRPINEGTKEIDGSREEKIKELIDANIKDFQEGMSENFLETLLRVGMKGYDDMSDKEVNEEYSRYQMQKEKKKLSREAKEVSPEEVSVEPYGDDAEV